MRVSVQCEWCGKEERVIPARAVKYRFCSYACRGAWRAVNWRGENHPNWQGERIREALCQHCGKSFAFNPYGEYVNKPHQFCSPECKKAGQKRYYGVEHPLYNPNSRRANRRGRHGAWARAVIGRDSATCQHCGAAGVELHAHHIMSYEQYPELRWEVSNGVTLCYRCHWAVHTASDANGVNSGDLRPGNAEDNPEPSFGRKPVEGVTTRGRAYRRWDGNCEECGKFISKRWSDTVGKAHLFCSRSCASKFQCRRQYAPKTAMAVIASTSALPERDDIV